MMTNRYDLSIQRWLLFGLVFSSTAVAVTRLLAIFRDGDVTLLQVLLLAVFAVLFAWITTSFWVGCLGAHALWRRHTRLPLPEPPNSPPVTDPRGARTVLVMPIHNESCTHVFARLQAIWESIHSAGAAEQFDLFILSDSTERDACESEQREWHRFCGSNPDARLFYRRRARNTGHKSGNIAEFCENWGALYDYMVVLDADSLMTGETLARLVRLMDANPRTALIQVAPLLVGGGSLFARAQQFASWAYGPVYAAGLAKLQGPDGNYWGHNAIIRIRPFIENCGLPILPGPPPLGGEIMSHDFVEAALLRRAGWDLWLATDMGGSYEASPPTLIEFLKRDRRWCQGNLQHVILMFAHGLRLPSRLHFALGAMSYLASPLWLVLVVLFALNAIQLERVTAVTFVGRYPMLAWPISHTIAFVSLTVAMMAMLFAPKILALALLLRDKSKLHDYGGASRAVVGVITECILSTLLAPVFMLSHSWFVLNILLGRATRWGVQLRGDEGVGLWQSTRAFAPHTVIALTTAAAAWYWTPGDFWCCLPLVVGGSLAILLCWATASLFLGRMARRFGLFLVRSETTGVPILDRYENLVAAHLPVAEDSTALTDQALKVA
jgi:membrane glycosyltransferase